MTRTESQKSLWARKIRQRTAHIAIPATVLVAVAVLVAACGSSKQPAAQPTNTTPTQSTSTSTEPPVQSTTPTTPAQPTSPPVQTTPTGTPSCATSELRVRLVRPESGGTAGTFYYLLQFTNVSGHTCQLYGYPGVSAYLNGHQVGAAAGREAGSVKRTVTLQPRASAHSVLPIVNVENYPATACRAVTATALKVYPPNETVATYVPYRFGACSVTSVQFLRVWPVEAGTGTSESPIVLSSKVTLGWQWPNLSSPFGVKHSYQVPPLPVLRSVSVGRHEGETPAYDRISFTFTGTFPSYDLFYVSGLTADPSGKPVLIEGDGVLRIHFTQAVAHDASGHSTVPSTRPTHVGFKAIAGYAQTGDFEGVITYGVGSFRTVPNSNVQPKVRVFEVSKADGLYIVAVDIQTATLGRA